MTGETAYLRSLCDISRAFAAAEKKEQLLNRIVESAIDTMKARAACLFLVDGENGAYVPAARQGISDSFLYAQSDYLQQQLHQILKTGYLHIRNPEADPRLESPEDFPAQSVASMLAVPVLVDNKPIGILALFTQEPRDFTETDIAFLSALADQGGIAIDRARLIAQLKKNARIFHNLASGISSSLEIPRIMNILTEGVSRALKAKAVSVRLIDPKDNTLKLISSHGLSRAYIEKGDIQNDVGIPEALAGESLIIRDVTTEEGVRYRSEKSAEGIVSILSVPIRAKSDVMGVLRLYFGTWRDFYYDELLMVEAIGHQAGMAILNASCYLKLETALQDLQSDIWSHRSWF